ncbi:hypothetical protein [Archangium lansingense]|uniref:Uncharacterized protein n=1 Tax=Archangium lansingense TaxID=2995310 RepID=A0ABT4A636_9BACT|nr:hypothetical protein [Archangium lansinium]MCY1077117.1 hypothetical protein [Archangium lansinium]
MTDKLASTLPADALQAIDKLILEGLTIPAFQLIMKTAGCSLYDAQDAFWERRDVLKKLHPVLRERDEEEARQSTPEAWRAKALQGLDRLEGTPVALETLWDGDTTGWFLVLSAILPGASREHPRFTAVHLVSMRGNGGDFRLFTGQVPPWPVSAVAQAIGRIAHERWNIPLYFPSPAQPENDSPRWWDTQAVPATS